MRKDIFERRIKNPKTPWLFQARKYIIYSILNINLNKKNEN